MLGELTPAEHETLNHRLIALKEVLQKIDAII